MARLRAEPEIWRLRLIRADRAHVGGLPGAWAERGRGVGGLGGSVLGLGSRSSAGTGVVFVL